MMNCRNGICRPVKTVLVFKDRICQFSKHACFFIDREDFELETGFWVPLRGYITSAVYVTL
jgi:hypothetical protein